MHFREEVAEFLWPTRCAICNTPGELVCKRCRNMLHYYDPWLACPLCGSPFGFHQCCECNSYIQDLLRRAGQLDNELRAAAFPRTSAVIFNEASARIVRCFKDADEQRLSDVMAAMMRNALSPDVVERARAVTYIPASHQAFLRRGYDHGELLARSLGALIGLPVVALFARPGRVDQRGLSRAERMANMADAFSLVEGANDASLPTAVILCDDVLTTGATLSAAAQTLAAAGVHVECGVTFARVV